MQLNFTRRPLDIENPDLLQLAYLCRTRVIQEGRVAKHSA